MSPCRRLVSSITKSAPLCDISRNLPGALDAERADGEAAGGDAEGTGAAAGAAAAPMANSRRRVVYALIFFVAPLIASDQAAARCTGYCGSHVRAGLHGRNQAPHLGQLRGQGTVNSQTRNSSGTRASRYQHSTPSRSAVLSRKQLGNAFNGSRAAANAGTGERTTTRHSRCNGDRCTVPNPPGAPIPIPYPNSGATGR
jgi:hypothetical protein